jgi:tRNA threonylcarbamoyl adenosine modification protein (Sua5/YciO/YrdC/YwlC family)
MAKIVYIHPENPQARLLQQVVAVLQRGGVVVYPTDSGYALGCLLGQKEALERIRQIRQLPAKHEFTLLCRDLKDIGTYALIDNPTYRLLRANTPGSYTFILPASRAVPKLLLTHKRKTIGLRIPLDNIALALLTQLEAPLLNVSMILPGGGHPPAEIGDFLEVLDKQVDVIIDAGFCGLEPTTMVDFTGDQPAIIREGRGAVDAFVW